MGTPATETFKMSAKYCTDQCNTIIMHRLVHNVGMVRPRQFDEKEVRIAALQIFLRNGYASTSLSDLEEATGIGRRSLYNSFGDKRTVFLRALEDFRATAVEQNLAPLEESGAGLDAIATVFNRLLKLAETPEGRLGCLMCNTSREPIATDKAVAEQITHYFSRVEQGFANVLTTAQKNGTLPIDENVTGLSHFYLGILVSISVMGRAGVPLKTLQDIVSEALKRIM
ncbi:MAG: TetR/AcrR family transcriptional regulator [Leptolyngbya sp. SIO3F4]|nr:TetR/AcrR family transcriptional regulator [Leptolyngbya sp. SIO3F4]